MLYQEALPKFWFVSLVSLLTIGKKHWRKLAATFEKPTQQINFRLCGNRCLFMWGAYLCMGTYKRNLVVNGCLYSWGAYFLWVPIIPILRYIYIHHTSLSF